MKKYFDIFKTHFEQNKISYLDIGASGGLTHPWNQLENHLSIFGFEPDIAEYNKLVAKNKTAHFYNIALNDKNETISINITKKQQVSSFYTPNYKFLKRFPDVERFEILKNVSCNSDLLDSVLSSEKYNTFFDFLKVDTQGSELAILNGAKELLSTHLLGIEVEVEFVELYQNQPLFGDVDKFLRSMGFEFYTFNNVIKWNSNSDSHHSLKSNGQLIFSDALYFKNDEVFQENISRLSEKEQRKRVIHFIGILTLYGFFGKASELMLKYNHLINQNELNVFIKDFAREPSNVKLSIFQRISRRLKRLLLNMGEKNANS